MDDTGILSFSNPRLERERVEAHASPTLELAYAYHRLVRGHRRDAEQAEANVRPFEMLFRDVAREHPDLIERIEGLAETGTGTHFEYEIFVLALEFGYVHDDQPSRFLDDLPRLPRRFLDRAAEQDDAGEQGDSSRVNEGIERLTDHGLAERVRDALRELWDVLRPTWAEEGRSAVADACHRFADAFAQKGDVLAALPSHHIAQFEASAEKLRAAQARDRVEVIPLYFASQGGFIFHLHDAYFIGFGVQVEQAFAHTESRVRAIAGRMKAYSDPTRLMLLTLLANYGRFTPTVGDLAAQLGVSQPTVSGHLRLLREAGLVRLEKDGTKSFYHLQTDAATEPLDELADLLQQPQR